MSEEAIKLLPSTFGLPANPVPYGTGPEEIGNLLQCAAKQGNLLGPMTQIDQIPPMFALSIRIILLPLRGMLDQSGNLKPSKYLDNGLWHKLPGGKLSMEKEALDHVASAAGVRYLGSRRLDDERDPYRWVIESGIQVRASDGTWRDLWDSVEYDLRQSSPQAQEAMGNPKDSEGERLRRLNHARKYGYRQAVSKARNRAIRSAFGIRAVDLTQAKLPFLIPALVFQPDMANPEVQRMILSRELGTVEQVYGRPQTMRSRNPMAAIEEAEAETERFGARR